MKALIVAHPRTPAVKLHCCVTRAEFGTCAHQQDAYPETPQTIQSAYQDNCAQRDQLHLDRLPEPKPYLLALRGELPADACAACGQPMALHYDSSGCVLLGCVAVPRRQRIARLVSRPLTVPEQYSNPYPTVAEAMDAALLTACGVTVTTFYEGLSASERLNLARRLAEIAVVAFKKSEGRL